MKSDRLKTLKGLLIEAHNDNIEYLNKGDKDAIKGIVKWIDDLIESAEFKEYKGD